MHNTNNINKSSWTKTTSNRSINFNKYSIIRMRRPSSRVSKMRHQGIISHRVIQQLKPRYWRKRGRRYRTLRSLASKIVWLTSEIIKKSRKLIKAPRNSKSVENLTMSKVTRFWIQMLMNSIHSHSILKVMPERPPIWSLKMNSSCRTSQFWPQSTRTYSTLIFILQTFIQSSNTKATRLITTWPRRATRKDHRCRLPRTLCSTNGI